MKWNVAFAALALTASGLAVASALPRIGGEGPEVGKPAPEIDGKVWLNNLGATPTLASFRGQAVLLEFWATW
jgi:hypothetical protein